MQQSFSSHLFAGFHQTPTSDLHFYRFSQRQDSYPWFRLIYKGKQDFPVSQIVEHRNPCYESAPSMPIHFPSHDLSIFTIPKNGGTTLWSWCHFVRTGEIPTGPIYKHAWMCDGPPLSRTIVVRRNPIGRFVSAYRNARDIRGLEVPFDQFVREFPNIVKTSESLLHHFRPQSVHVDDRKIEDFSEVLDFEDFPLVKLRLEEILKCALPDIHLQKSYCDDFTVSDEHIELIQEYYVDDFLAGFGEIESE